MTWPRRTSALALVALSCCLVLALVLALVAYATGYAAIRSILGKAWGLAFSDMQRTRVTIFRPPLHFRRHALQWSFGGVRKQYQSAPASDD
jgi:hypothetical protein